MAELHRAGLSDERSATADRDTLFHAIRAAGRGEMLLQPELMARVLALPTHAAEKQSSLGSRESAELTEREKEILRAVARGERSKEIAAHLGISIRTVGAHLASIYSKLGVDSRASAVALALQWGLLDYNHQSHA